MKKGPKPDAENGRKLFNALRELEVQFLNGGHSVQTSVQKLLKDHDVPYVKELAKYLIAQSVVVRDEEHSTHKKPYYWYNGPRLTIKYCNELIMAMKIDRSTENSGKPPLPPGYVEPKTSATVLSLLAEAEENLEEADEKLYEASIEYKKWKNIVEFLKSRTDEI